MTIARFNTTSNHFCLLQNLQVMKVNKFRIGVICFVTELNRSSTVLPQAVLKNNGTVSVQLYYL